MNKNDYDELVDSFTEALADNRFPVMHVRTDGDVTRISFSEFTATITNTDNNHVMFWAAGPSGRGPAPRTAFTATGMWDHLAPILAEYGY